MNEAINETNGLSDRELDVLRLVATGASNKEIARDLSISQNTVKVHLRNIFSKIGAASRTEAAMYAVREGLIPAPPESQDGPGSSSWSVNVPALQEPSLVQRVWGNAWSRLGILAVLITLAVGSVIVLVSRPQTPTTLAGTPLPTALPRWLPDQPLPEGRSGLAVATYENLIYAIAGESVNSVVGTVYRFIPADNRWESMASKPMAVTDIQAAVIGGRIFVPGGRRPDGTLATGLEIYEPRQDTWSQGAALPIPVSGYALAAFEGQLFLFGGWDGESYLASVFVYDPDQDVWETRTDMPTARAFASAGVAGGRIYVLGGTGEQGILAVNEEYTPEAERAGEVPWRSVAPMPQGRSGLGVASIANILHVFGGEGQPSVLPSLKYFPVTNLWEPFESVDSRGLSHMGLVAVDTSVHMIGGLVDNQPVPDHFAYQAIFTIAIPVVPGP